MRWPPHWRRRYATARRWQKRLTIPVLATLAACWVSLSFSLFAPDPPRDADNLCAIFREQPDWYDYAAESERRWGTPIATQMAFVFYESAFQSHAQPPRTQLMGFIPWTRPSTAYGYAQALDPTWAEYLEAQNDGFFVVRTHMKHALDFIGWYNRLTHEQLGISLRNARHLYLAYHEGRSGYRRASFRAKPDVTALSQRVASRASRYGDQLSECEAEFQCRHFYQVWPFCKVATGSS
ncbi:lysozyme-like domain containing protein [Marinobacteraceae bacterium S3BR75-40.1]